MDDLDGELERLKGLASGALESLELPDIMQAYHQAISTSCTCSALESNPALYEEIASMRSYLSGTFELEIHPKIMAHMSASIDRIRQDLQSRTPRSKEEIQAESAMYEDLKKRMSTYEFLKQYKNK